MHESQTLQRGFLRRNQVLFRDDAAGEENLPDQAILGHRERVSLRELDDVIRVMAEFHRYGRS